ncbi:hypothetical protein [Plantactinospora sonchi]|uniref:Uncharacterized protein n=1 Tax=Plantactinospora sonchi TaxID=1544735 RepID=A0ABU7S0D9_9ACTN
MAHDLRDGLARLAEPVVSRPEPYRRLLERLRRQRRRRALTAGAAAVAVVVAAVPLLGGTVRGFDAEPAGPVELQPPGQIDTPLERQLLDSPPRGNLAGDHELIDNIARGYRAARAELLVDPALDAVRVLFAHDLPNARLVVVAFTDDDSQAVLREAIADPGASVRGLLDKTGTPVDALGFGPIFSISRMPAAGTSPDDVRLALGPSGCVVEASSNGQLTADGTVRRDWRPIGGDGYAVTGPEQAAERWRFSCDGVPRYDVSFGSASGRPDATAVPPGTPDSVDPTAAANAARWLTDALDRNGLAVGSVRLRWHGRIPGAPADTPPVLLVTSCGSGGGCAALLQVGMGRFEPPSPADEAQTVRYSRWLTAVGRPDLVVAPIPTDPDGVLVVGPDSATRVELVGDGNRVVAEGPLKDGVGRLEPGEEKVRTIRVYDASDRLVTSMPARPEFGSVHFGEERVWP